MKGSLLCVVVTGVEEAMKALKSYLYIQNPGVWYSEFVNSSFSVVDTGFSYRVLAGSTSAENFSPSPIGRQSIMYGDARVVPAD